MQPAGEPLESWPAGSIGARVRRVGRGHVHSAFAHAVNLAGEDGDLTVLLTADAPRVGHGVRLREFRGDLSRWFSIGAAFRWDGEDLYVVSRFAATVRIATGDSHVWHGRVRRASWPSPGPLATLSRNGERDLFVYWGERNPRAACHAPSPLTGEGWGEGDSLAQRVLNMRLLALREAYRNADADAIAHAVHGLIGLGPGLTPAGDDALIGWLAGIELLGTDRRRELLCQAVRERVTRTTDVSRAHLEDALAGEFSEPLARFANALLRSPAEAPRALADLAAVGATSGLDAAAGLFAALRAATAPRPYDTEPCSAQSAHA
jgi:hypothetical protein